MEAEYRLARELYMRENLLIITHDYEFIQTVCSRVLVLRDGSITETKPGVSQLCRLEKMMGVDYGTDEEK